LVESLQHFAQEIDQEALEHPLHQRSQQHHAGEAGTPEHHPDSQPRRGESAVPAGRLGYGHPGDETFAVLASVAVYPAPCQLAPCPLAPEAECPFPTRVVATSASSSGVVASGTSDRSSMRRTASGCRPRAASMTISMRDSMPSGRWTFLTRRTLGWLVGAT